MDDLAKHLPRLETVAIVAFEVLEKGENLQQVVALSRLGLKAREIAQTFSQTLAVSTPGQ